MFDLQTIVRINEVAAHAKDLGIDERHAVAIVTDDRLRQAKRLVEGAISPSRLVQPAVAAPHVQDALKRKCVAPQHRPDYSIPFSFLPVKSRLRSSQPNAQNVNKERAADFNNLPKLEGE